MQKNEFLGGGEFKTSMEGYILNEKMALNQANDSSVFSKSLFYMHGHCELIKDEQSNQSIIVHGLLKDQGSY